MYNLVVDSETYLEELGLKHVDNIFDAINNNRKFLRRWLPFVDFTNKPGDTEKFVRSILKKQITFREKVFVIWHNNLFAGLIGFKEHDRINDKIEIGYWLIENMTGKGIITKSTSKMVDYAFRNLDMNRIQIKCGVGNLKSSAVPRRLGFFFEGIERHGERHNKKYIDLEVFSMLRHEWVQILF